MESPPCKVIEKTIQLSIHQRKAEEVAAKNHRRLFGQSVEFFHSFKWNVRGELKIKFNRVDTKNLT